MHRAVESLEMSDLCRSRTECASERIFVWRSCGPNGEPLTAAGDVVNRSAFGLSKVYSCYVVGTPALHVVLSPLMMVENPSWLKHEPARNPTAALVKRASGPLRLRRRCGRV